MSRDMRIVAFVGRNSAHHAQAAFDFGEGLKAHGFYNFAIREKVDAADCDLAVFWGHRFSMQINAQRSNGRDYLVMERGYFRDRMAYTSLGLNGLNGRAEFPGREDAPDDRWMQHGVDVAPWRDPEDGHFVAVMGQVPGDASIEGVDFRRWLERALGDCVPYDMPIVVRPHPLGAVPVPHGYEVHTGDLDELLHHCAVVVTFNSNSAVDAVLAGVPTIACDPGSMAWDVTGRVVGVQPPTPDRTAWLNGLGYCQWTTDEIRSGHAWDHLKQRWG